MAKRSTGSRHTFHIVRDIICDDGTRIPDKLGTSNSLQRAISRANGFLAEQRGGTVQVVGTDRSHLTGTLRKNILTWRNTETGTVLKAYDVTRIANPWY